MSDATFENMENFFASRFNTDKGAADNYAPYLSGILQALNWRGDIRALSDSLPYTQEKKGLGFTDFLNVMALLGYAPKILKAKAKDIPEEAYPCLFIPKGEDEAGEILHEPSQKDIKGRAFIFKEDHGNADIIPDKTITVSGRPWFARLLYRFKGIFGQVLLASFFINILALVTPLFMMSVYDKVIGAYSRETLNYLLIGVVLAVGVEFSLRFLRTKSLSWFGARIDYIVSNTILAKLMALPASYTERASVAAQLSRLKAFESVREFFTGPLFLSFVEFPFTLILLTAIALIAGPLVFVPIVISALYVVLLISMRGRLKALTARLAEANSARQNMTIETLGKQETLRCSGGFDAWLERYEKTSAESSYAGYLYNRSINFIDTVSQGLVILGSVAMIYFGVERIWAEQMSMGAMIAVLILTWRTLAPLQMACTALPRLDQVKRNIEQINRLMELKPECDPIRSHQDTPCFKGEIEFHNVGLRYSKDADPVYAGLSFIAKQGQLVAITGANSTGKSTTLKLVTGLYPPQVGAVRIDGTDIRQIDPVKLRQNIAYVGQEPEFFTMSVEENLRLMKPDVSYEEIGSAIKQAGLEDWVRSLPDGLETIIGHASSYDVPSALRPHLALVRAYLQDNPIILIDEMPYEFLNSKAGENFYKFLQKQKGRKTIFYITYRQDYIDLADLVIQLYDDERPQVKEKKNG